MKISKLKGRISLQSWNGKELQNRQAAGLERHLTVPSRPVSTEGKVK